MNAECGKRRFQNSAFRIHHSASALHRLAYFALAAAVGLCAFAAAVQFGEPTKKKLLFAAALPAVAIACWITRRPKMVLVFLWVVALPYNRMYYIFDSVVGNHGPQGPYVIPADAILTTLFGLWAYELVVLKRTPKPSGPRMECWLLPFGLACLCSSLGARHMSWGIFEMLRLVKIAAIFVYVRYNITPLEGWACAAGLMCSLLVQAGVAVLQVALRSTSGVLGLLGGGAEDTGLQQIGEAAVGGWLRAVGTVGHPSNLACYMLLAIPLAAAVTVAAQDIRVRLLSGLVTLAGLGGLACTLSRWPVALAMGQLALLALVLTRLGFLRAQQTIGLFCVSTFMGAVALIPVSDLIYRRITQDLGASLEFRAKDAQVALAMFKSAPLVGVGLNNYAAYLLERDPEMRWTIDNAETVRHTLKIRTFVALHNFYLFMLAETGLLGLTTLIIFYLGVLYRGVRNTLAASGVWQAIGAGLLVGIVGVLGQGFVDFSFWVDPILYTFAIIAALLGKLAILDGEDKCAKSLALGSAARGENAQ